MYGCDLPQNQMDSSIMSTYCVISDDALILSHNPQHSIDSITAVFKLKNDKAEVPDMYLGVQIEKVTSNEGTT